MTDATVSQRMYDINHSVETTVNESILVNIVRASKYQPLNFVALGKVSGSQQVDLKTGLPTFTFGPNLTASQKQFAFGNNVLDNNASTSFDVAILGSKEFYKGLMTPLNLVDVNLLIRQGIPRKLLFYLVIDSIRYSPNSHPETASCAMKNDPTDPESYEDFREAIEILMAFGATTETRDELNPKYPPGGKSGGGASSGSGSGNTGEPYAIAAARLCFDPAIAVRNHPERDVSPPSAQYLCRGKWSRAEFKCTDRKTEELRDDGSCPAKDAGGNGAGSTSRSAAPGAAVKGSGTGGGGPSSGYSLMLSRQDIAGIKLHRGAPAAAPWRSDKKCSLSSILSGKPRLLDFTVETRSTYGIFNYLGRLLTDGNSPTLDAPNGSGPLLRVERGQFENCFAAVNYNQDNYCVPEAHSDRTKQAFAVLGQLLALKTAAGDLPNTPTVRVTP
jgi:hypothetical protein